ncbi:uncharacterized protein [Panulirus ornatus]|uniref:uncharacterized protein n=1 Tax=Panulirus ornatus TaxID=150431 RepID=UPI003A8B23FF
MSVVAWALTAAFSVALALAPPVAGQRAPCYECELYKDSHPHSNPYIAIRAHCVYPCGCEGVPECPPGVRVIMDGCGCCWQCARQLGQPCDGAVVCDVARGLTCHYNSTADPTGTCQEVQPAKCTVNNRTYDHGQTFKLDCRTQCTCQNGTYACVSLCPSESIPPSSQCHNPHLLTVPGQCCREWMCDTDPGKAVTPPRCERVSGRWSRCTQQTCGAGVSVRWSTDNAECQPMNETRLCQVRPCQEQRQQGSAAINNIQTAKPSRKHHIRRGHTCKATLRLSQSVRFRVGWCVSEHRYRPKQCAACDHHSCNVSASTTISVAFLCPLHYNSDLTAPRPRYHILARRRRTRPVTHAPTRGPDAYLQGPHGDHSGRDPHAAGHLPTNYYTYRLDGSGSNDEDTYRLDSSSNHHEDTYRLDSNSNNDEDTYRLDDRGSQDEDTYRLDGRGSHDEDTYRLDGSGSNHEDTYRLDGRGSNDEDTYKLLEDSLPSEHPSLTVEGDLEYDHIKSDNYEVVHRQVEWILRCKCSPSRTSSHDPRGTKTGSQAATGKPS